MSSRPLSVLIPSSWSQQNKGPASIRSNASSTQVHSPSWSTLSFDQLSLYAKKASNSSLTLLASSSEHEDKKRRRQRDKISQAIQGFSQVLYMSLNDCSLGFYRISDHIHRKVPRIVETKKKLRQSSQKVQVAILDIEDVRKNVCDIERIESFYNITKMIEKSLDILRQQR
ncbi:hypothetical protein MFLAVUS_000396 [Mucor flavus]|uniref:Uncharacterized protein n=1 Tax=Mucor flavus TaxID=439312 RepID=A0ABP9YJN6_9FUNG